MWTGCFCLFPYMYLIHVKSLKDTWHDGTTRLFSGSQHASEGTVPVRGARYLTALRRPDACTDALGKVRHDKNAHTLNSRAHTFTRNLPEQSLSKRPPNARLERTQPPPGAISLQETPKCSDNRPQSVHGRDDACQCGLSFLVGSTQTKSGQRFLEHGSLASDVCRLPSLRSAAASAALGFAKCVKYV